MNEPQLKIYEFGEFRVDTAIRLLTGGDGRQVPLKPKVFDTLCYLVRNAGKVIGKDELMREIWADSVVEENNLNQNISTLRRVFGEKPGEQRFIVTVPGHGYRFVPDVRVITADGQSDPAAEIGSGQMAQAKSRGTKLFWMASLGVIGVLGLSFLGLYFFRENASLAAAPIKSIAVLPFKPLVLENRNEALELGMADTLISKLSDGEQLSVLPLSSIRRYNSIEQDPLTAGRELGVEAVLDGTIQNWGNKIRVSSKLLRTSDGKQLWAGQFDKNFTDILTVQAEISEKVAMALKIRLAGHRRSTEDVEAYRLYMNGLYHVNKGTLTDLRASIPFFQQAIDIDPRYALAYTGLSKAYGVLAISGGMPPAEAIAKSKSAGQKAIEIDDTLVEARHSICMGIFWHDWDWAAAEKECLRAIEIDPDNSDSHGHYAMILSSTGRHEEALAEARKSRELDPLNLAQSALEGQFLLHAGQVDEALERLRKTSELEPNFWMPHLIAASAYIEKGMYAEAIAESRKEYELSGGNIFPYGIYAMARSGKRDEARAELNELLILSATKYVSPYNIALIYNALDERENALDWLEKGYENRDPKMTYLKVEPKWNNLRNEPRFVDLMKRMNL